VDLVVFNDYPVPLDGLSGLPERDDNPYSESLFRTLKYTPADPSKPFESIKAARQRVHGFVQWYNE
jgi:hypothetical protein